MNADEDRMNADDYRLGTSFVLASVQICFEIRLLP